MINVIEAQKMAEKNNNEQKMLKKVAESVLPLFDNIITHCAGRGLYECLVKRDEIMDMASTNTCFFFTKKQTLDAVANELRSYGFEVVIPDSYTSIHVKW